jgi:hypothetical protein
MRDVDTLGIPGFFFPFTPEYFFPDLASFLDRSFKNYPAVNLILMTHGKCCVGRRPYRKVEATRFDGNRQPGERS